MYINFIKNGSVKSKYIGIYGFKINLKLRQKENDIVTTIALENLCIISVQENLICKIIHIEKQSPRSSDLLLCLICHMHHPLRFCKRFLKMSYEERQRRVRQHGYCQNCLARSHRTDDCTSDYVCNKCGWAHHTLLHRPRGQEREIQPRQSRLKSRQQSPRLTGRLGNRYRQAVFHHPSGERSSERLQNSSVTTNNNTKKNP